MKRLLFQGDQNCDVEKIDCRSAWSGFGMEVFATLSHVLIPSAGSLQIVAGIFELRLKLPMNLAKHDVFSVEKSINHSLLVIHSAK
jgi:hypothetical protein